MHAILCFGDSITFGRGEIPNYSWVERLKKYFEPKGGNNAVYNLGVSGHNSNDLLKRFDVESIARVRIQRLIDKYLTIITIGQNDSRWTGTLKDKNPETTEEKFEKNIQELISKSKNYQTKTIFLGLFPVNESLTLPFDQHFFKNSRIDIYNNILKTKCQKNNILFLNLFEIIKKENHTELTDDGLHPNSKGYEFMFEKIKEFLEENNLL